jgi:glycosyltransferase involved in cell wall biosynthesis
VAYQAADVFVLPSREDPFPLVCLEAAATGLPVVAFREAGGMASFIEDDAGLVVEEIGGGSLAAAIRRLELDPELRSRLGHRGAAKVRERHDVADAARRIRQLLGGLAPSAGE